MAQLVCTYFDNTMRHFIIIAFTHSLIALNNIPRKVKFPAEIPPEKQVKGRRSGVVISSNAIESCILTGCYNDHGDGLDHRDHVMSCLRIHSRGLYKLNPVRQFVFGMKKRRKAHNMHTRSFTSRNVQHCSLFLQIPCEQRCSIENDDANEKNDTQM